MESVLSPKRSAQGDSIMGLCISGLAVGRCDLQRGNINPRRNGGSGHNRAGHIHIQGRVTSGGLGFLGLEAPDGILPDDLREAQLVPVVCRVARGLQVEWGLATIALG